MNLKNFESVLILRIDTRFANGSEHREARAQCSLGPPSEDEAYGSARTCVLPAPVMRHWRRTEK